MAIEQIASTPTGWMEGLPPMIESLEEAWDFIQALDLSNARNKLSHPRWGKPLPDKVIDHAERDYRRFLFLMRKHSGRPFSPTLDIDLVWHEHVLDTIPYFQETAAIFGRYLHHLPGKPSDGDDGPPLEEGRANTHEMYLREFGEPLQTYFAGKVAG